MDIDLSYIDYTAIGLTLPNTLKILPQTTSKNNCLKIATGDKDGVLQVCSLKNDDVQLAFKTLPGEPITSVHLAGSSQGGAIDKIFVSSGTEVRGYTKKGKLFLALETNLAETIIAMWVHDADLLVAGTHCMTHYKDCKEVGSYLCGDTILDLGAIQLPNSNRIVGVVACSGGAVRGVERGRALGSGRVPGGPRILISPHISQPSTYLLCGTDEGSLHSLILDREHGSIAVEEFVEIGKGAGVSSLGWWEVTHAGGGAPLLLLARSDGVIQIYRLKPDDPHYTPQLLFTHECNESITSVWGWSGGVVAATRSGRIMGLVPPVTPAATAARLNTLKNEVDELESRVEKERARYRLATQPLSQGLSAIPALQISEEVIEILACPIWGSVEGDGARRVCISLGAPLDTLLLQSTAPLKLLDAAPNTALLTMACDPQSSNTLLATYRCQANTQRLEMRVGAAFEGLSAAGVLRIYVTPFLQPKCSQLLVHYIPPLSWHVLTHDYDDNREYNTLTVGGAFSKAELHSWLTLLLLDIPSRVSSSEPLILSSVITDTILHCVYQKGEANFKSDNISTISTIKDFLSLEATKKKVQLEILCHVNDDSILSTVFKLHPKILESFQRVKENKLFEALRELEVSGQDLSLNDQLCPEYVKLLQEPPSKDEGKKRPNLQQLYDIIINLFIDRNKLKGLNMKSKTTQLRDILKNYSLENVVSFFGENLN